ncbi:unnamed protein product, partial [Polarella glacialis]
DLYELLGLRRDDQNLGAEEFRSAYKRSACRAHPDKGGSQEHFHAVVRAFEVLSCAASRDAYDGALARGLPEAVALAIAAKGSIPSSDTAAKPGKRRRGQSVPLSSETALQQLRAAVSELPREERRGALDKLVPRVREALLAYMQKAQAPAALASAAPAASPVAEGESESSCE